REDPLPYLPCYEVEVVRWTVQVLVFRVGSYRLLRCCLLISRGRLLLASVSRVKLCVLSHLVTCWSILMDSLFSLHWRNRLSQDKSSLLLWFRSPQRCYCN